MNDLAVKLCSEHSLLLDEYERLINGRTPELAENLRKKPLPCENAYTVMMCMCGD